MSKIISEHYEDELVNWLETIHYYNEEMSELENKLADVIKRNTIPDIAGKVETEQDKLNAINAMFNRLEESIVRQEQLLKADDTLIDDALINKETANQQDALRRQMQAAEKEYIDVKFACYNFLSSMLK